MTVPHYGKREAGNLIASSPGDTLYFNFGSYNDSGDSEALAGLAVTDIEVFKNGDATTRATDSGYSLISDTGQIGDRVGLYRFSVQLFNTSDDTGHYESDAWYQVAIDSVTIDGRTVRMWVGSFEIGRQRVDVREIVGDTGAANYLNATFAGGFADTGINQRLAQIQSDVDTGLRAQISDVDTGLHDAITDLDTGLRDYIDNTDTGLRAFIDDLDTGIKQRFDALAEDTGGVDVNSIAGDTGAAFRLRDAFVSGFTDTGINERLARIQSDVDTGLRAYIDDSDTGIKDAITDLDTGLRGILQTTGVNISQIGGDTGASDRLLKFAGTSLSSGGQVDTGTLAGTQAGTIDANVTHVNETQVQGTGASGDEWRPV